MNNLQRIAEQESDAFTSEQFGQLDLSGFPELQKPPLDSFTTPDPHGFNRMVETGSRGLRELADAPDAETLSRIAEETGDENLAAKIRDENEGIIADEFVRTHPTYYRTDDNYNSIRDYLDERRQPFTLSNIHLAFTELTRTGAMISIPGCAKPLTPSEKLHVINLSKSGRIEDAISQYLDYALPDADRHWQNGTEFLSDPSSLDVRNAAVRFVFMQSQSHVRDTDEFRTFEREFFKRRPLQSFNDYKEAYRQFEQSEKLSFRSRILADDEPAPDIESLSDDQVGDLTRKTLHARARQLIQERRRKS
jgi:hypothetical protein